MSVNVSSSPKVLTPWTQGWHQPCLSNDPKLGSGITIVIAIEVLNLKYEKKEG